MSVAVLGRVLGAIVRLAPPADGSAGVPPVPKETKDGVQFAEAIEWHRRRTSISKADFLALDAVSARRAFTVANLTQLDLIAEVHGAIDKAVADGTTLEQFKKAIGTKLEAGWSGTVADPGGRIETIFRNGVQTAYNAGWYQQARQSAQHPYWRFDGILDVRQSKVCRPLNGVIRHRDDPWWKTRIPPLHHRCRSGVRALTAAEAKRRGLTADEKLPRDDKDELIGAQKGFGAAPETTEAIVEGIKAVAAEKLAGAPPALAAVARAKVAAAPHTGPLPPKPGDVPAPDVHKDPARPIAPVAKATLLGRHRAVVEAFESVGVRVVVEDYEDPRIKRHLDDLALLDARVIDRIGAAGLAEIHIADRQAPDLDSNQDMKGVRGPVGRWWDEIPGCWNPTAKSVSIGTGGHGSESLALHEIGHAALDVLGLLGVVETWEHVGRQIRAGRVSPDFLAAYTIDGGDQTAAVPEVLAEAIVAMFLHRDGVLEVERQYDSAFAEFLARRLFGR